MPRSSAVSKTLRVPSTLVRLPGLGSRTPILYQPATWKTPSEPRIPAAMLALSVMSPGWSRMPVAASSPAAAGLRTSAVTSWPPAVRRRASRPPMNPVAPVMKYRTETRLLRRTGQDTAVETALDQRLPLTVAGGDLPSSGRSLHGEEPELLQHAAEHNGRAGHIHPLQRSFDGRDPQGAAVADHDLRRALRLGQDLGEMDVAGQHSLHRCREP